MGRLLFPTLADYFVKVRATRVCMRSGGRGRRTNPVCIQKINGRDRSKGDPGGLVRGKGLAGWQDVRLPRL